MINYIFYTIVSLGSAYLVYYFFLKKQKTFQFNRFFLLGSLLLCLLAPVMEINMFDAVPSITEISLESSQEAVFPLEVMKGVTVTEIQKPNHTLYNILWYLYLGITVCFLLRFIKNLFGIIKLTKQSHIRIGNLKLVETNDYKNASSFFNYLFVNSESLKDKQYSEPMIQHELVHCNHLHTIDVVLIELLLCVFWFNPLMWLYKKAIVQNHEFIADTYTVETGIDIEDYSQIIINSGHMEHRVPLTSGFNFIQIKNRIIMLHQSKSSILKRTLKISTALILFSGIFVLSSFKNSNEQIVVVIDAGHGGHDPGNLNEKDIVLNISNVLAELSDENVKIITLRDEDKFLSLKDRVKFINAQNADLMLSLHCNSAKNPDASGVEAFYYDKNEFDKQSLDFGQILVKNQLQLFSSRGKVKKASFYMLKNVNCPAVILELGFLSNEKDNAILTNEVHQKSIAKSIHESLLKIGQGK
ncbi:N-acetylmuramoyl-L-alanine amidase [Psychroserpens jangbogonensis]|uniref:N-acetylmuramoyl-L-alanine amidase n=1 Tax=Psychroserpens jangbogonensis TaxID=1484460 RepID=UPI000689A0C3|nr:N-acetylmuramoyl-L-alanine amidase [Psychroserpens jangbogonensis]